MKTNILKIKKLCFSIFFFTILISMDAQDDSTGVISYQDVQTLFQKIGTYDKMVIKTDLDSIIINKKSTNDQPATILFYGEKQPTLKFNTKIKARGKYRRVKCEIPPLKLNFSKSELSDQNLYRNFDKLKLVTHCSIDGKMNDVVLKEHWVYKMYNTISDHSFNVKLFSIEYVHNKDANRKWEGECFILEPSEEMAYRYEGEIVDTMAAKIKDVTSKSYHHFLMFNYMIGNTDWKISTQKNLKFLRCPETEKLIVVPYDFDNCRFVDAPYMTLYPDAKVRKLDNRHVKQKFTSKVALHEEIELFKSLNDELNLHCYYQCEKLIRSEKLKMKSYLKPFFKCLKKKKRLENEFLD